MTLSVNPILHFMPSRGLFGDPIPFYWQGVYHVFFQNSPNGLGFNGMSWSHITSKDLIHWDILPDALVPEPNSPDAYGCWTGSIIYAKEQFHIFYTGCAKPDAGCQTICHATSDDLVSWTKNPANPILKPSPPYAGKEKSAWRDPCVFLHQDHSYRMILSSEHNVSANAFQSCFSEALSSDLINWKMNPPFYAPFNTFKMECADFFQLQGTQVLLYSDLGVQIRCRNCESDQWNIPDPAVLDHYRFYAGKTLLDENGRRLLFGFIFNRESEHDDSNWLWGGVMAFPRELYQDDQKRFCLRPAHELESLRHEKIDFGLSADMFIHGNWQVLQNEIEGISSDSSSVVAIIGQHPDQAEFSMNFDLSGQKNVGILLHATTDLSQGYLLELNPVLKTMSFKRLLPKYVGGDLNLQSIALPKDMNDHIQVTILLDNSLMEVFVDERICFSTRMYELDSKARCWGYYSKDGYVKVSNIHLWKLALS